MSVGVLTKRPSQLFWRSDPQVADNATMHRVRIVRTENSPGEVRAVRRNQRPSLAVGSLVESPNQPRILRRARLDFKGVNRSEVRGADQFVPVSTWCATIRKIWNERFQVIAAVAVAQKRSYLLISKERYVFLLLYRVEVRQERNSNPVISANSHIATQHDSGFIWCTGAEYDRRAGADVTKVDGGMAGTGECTIVAVRFPQQQCRRTPRPGDRPKAEEQNGSHNLQSHNGFQCNSSLGRIA